VGQRPGFGRCRRFARRRVREHGHRRRK
jgi:hypothetical protein